MITKIIKNCDYLTEIAITVLDEVVVHLYSHIKTEAMKD